MDFSVANNSWYSSIPLVKYLIDHPSSPYLMIGLIYYIVVIVLAFPLFFREYNLLKQFYMYPILYTLLLPIVLVILNVSVERALRFHFSWFVFTLYILWLAFSLLWVAFYFDSDYIEEKYRKLPPTYGDRSVTVFTGIVSTFIAVCLTAYLCDWMLIFVVLYGVYQIFVSIIL